VCDQGTGRWLQLDPESFAAGESNLMRYVGNDPTNAIDPSGRQEQDPRKVGDVTLITRLDRFNALMGSQTSGWRHRLGPDVPNTMAPDDCVLSQRVLSMSGEKRAGKLLSWCPGCIILGVGLGLIVLTLYLGLILYARSSPAPRRMLVRHRKEMDTYIASLYSGHIPLREDGKGYYLLDIMREYDVKTVVANEGCIVIEFASLPTDPVSVLMYSPRGKMGLPLRYLVPSPTWSYYALEPIDDLWFYCVWDL
jgi:hypothetical protein